MLSVNKRNQFGADRTAQNPALLEGHGDAAAAIAAAQRYRAMEPHVPARNFASHGPSINAAQAGRKPREAGCLIHEANKVWPKSSPYQMQCLPALNQQHSQLAFLSLASSPLSSDVNPNLQPLPGAWAIKRLSGTQTEQG